MSPELHLRTAELDLCAVGRETQKKLLVSVELQGDRLQVNPGYDPQCLLWGKAGENVLRRKGGSICVSGIFKLRHINDLNRNIPSLEGMHEAETKGAYKARFGNA